MSITIASGTATNPIAVSLAPHAAAARSPSAAPLRQLAVALWTTRRPAASMKAVAISL